MFKIKPHLRKIVRKHNENDKSKYDFRLDQSERTTSFDDNFYNDFLKTLKQTDFITYPYLDELMLPKDYITIESPYEQVDLIIESLKKLSKVDFSKVVIESKDKILNNKEMLLKYYDKIISEIYNFILVEN